MSQEQWVDRTADLQQQGVPGRLKKNNRVYRWGLHVGNPSCMLRDRLARPKEVRPEKRSAYQVKCVAWGRRVELPGVKKTVG